jgi:hypothetical protein
MFGTRRFAERPRRGDMLFGQNDRLPVLLLASGNIENDEQPGDKSEHDLRCEWFAIALSILMLHLIEVFVRRKGLARRQPGLFAFYIRRWALGVRCSAFADVSDPVLIPGLRLRL